jgi:hypothetical protein
MSPELEGLVLEMVRNSADVLRKSPTVMLPAVMLSKEPPKPAAITVVDYRPLPDAVGEARDMARAMTKDVKAYVVAWDGYVRIGADRTEAILMEAWEDGSSAVLLAQQYRRDPFELLGSVIEIDATI